MNEAVDMTAILLMNKRDARCELWYDHVVVGGRQNGRTLLLLDDADAVDFKVKIFNLARHWATRGTMDLVCPNKRERLKDPHSRFLKMRNKEILSGVASCQSKSREHNRSKQHGAASAATAASSSTGNDTPTGNGSASWYGSTPWNGISTTKWSSATTARDGTATRNGASAWYDGSSRNGFTARNDASWYDASSTSTRYDAASSWNVSDFKHE